MEPNTGITFADVAGVDEAKQDFMEVGCCPLHLSVADSDAVPIMGGRLCMTAQYV